MSNSFKNRVFGSVIIKSINSNYNADFSHQPRTLPNGVVYATDKALKYTVRNYWNDFYKDKNIFFFRSYNNEFKPMTLDERYISLFKEFKTTIVSDTFCLFHFDGEQIKGIIPNRPKSKDVKETVKELKENEELKSLGAFFEKLADKKTKELKVKDVNISEEEECIFYIDKDNQIIKAEGTVETIQSTALRILETMGGGINRIEVLKNLLECLDIRIFGATYAGKTNISVHGTCQITHGVNRFLNNHIYTEQIMSPFRNPKEKNEDSTQTTLGTQSKLQEGHYVHHFSINPKNIKDDVTRTSGMTLSNEDIAKLKEGLRKGATYYDSAAKAGTENELLLWVQLKEDSLAVLPSFIELISVNENKEIDLKEVKELLSKEHFKNEIEKIELYYNDKTTKVLNIPEGSEKMEL